MVSFDQFFRYPGQEQVPVAAAEDAFLATCSPQEWELIAAHTDTVRVDPGAVVIAAGSVERTLMILLRGRVGVSAPAGAGRRREPVTVLDAGSVVGELGFLDGEAAEVDVVALDPCELMRLPLGRFEVLAAKDPQLGLYLLFDLGRVLAGSLRAARRALP